MDPIKTISGNSAAKTKTENESSSKRSGGSVAASHGPRASSLPPQTAGPASFRSGDSRSNDYVMQGLKILQAAFGMEVEQAFGRSPEQHIQEAQKYGSFQAYHDAEWTPEKVSGRIINFAMSKFEQWYLQHQNMPRDEALDKYSSIVLQAMQTGFNRAIKALGDVPEDTRAELDKTISLAKEGVQAWHDQQQGSVLPE